MARFVTRYNQNGQQYIAFPLDVKYQGDGYITVRNVYVRNIFVNTNNIQNQVNYVFHIDRSLTNYDNATIGALSNVDISTGNYPDILNRDFSLQWEFRLYNENYVSFEVLFDPNQSLYVISRGEFQSELVIEAEENGADLEPITFNLSGVCDSKIITMIDGVDYTNIISVYGRSKTNIQNL